MNEHLERIIVADEDARAHLDAAGTAAEARITAARAECQARAEAAAASRRQVLEAQLNEIQQSADRTVSARQLARASHAEARRRAADHYLAEAAGVYARLVREGATPRRVT